MRTILTATFIILFFSCKKKDIPDNPSPSPIVLKDSVSGIIKITQKDLNGFDLAYQVNPKTGDEYTDVYLQWSMSADFISGTDSVLLGKSVSTATTGTFQLTSLNQASKYYLRIGFSYKNKRFFSSSKDLMTDSLKIFTDEHTIFSDGVGRGDSVDLKSNFWRVYDSTVFGTKVLIGNYDCTVLRDIGDHIFFRVPANIPSGKYILELRRKGIIVRVSDSVEVLRGEWRSITPPPLPLDQTASFKGLYWYGTTHNDQKGWLVGGNLANMLPNPENSNNGYLYEFDAQSEQWTKRSPVNRRYIENPVCHYYNNSIYVINGIEMIYNPEGTAWAYRGYMKTMKRLDLTSLRWYDLDTLPFRDVTGTPSFTYNNEFYIGMGANYDSLDLCCGQPTPSKKLLKYNPVTNIWTRLADFPGGHEWNPTFFVIGSKAYVYYGAIPLGDLYISTQFRQELWEYDILLNTWKQLALPAVDGLPPGEKYQIVTYNGKAYFLIGQVYKVGVASYYFDTTYGSYEYDPITGIFRKIVRMRDPNVLKFVFNVGKKFYFQADALGAFETRSFNKTYSFVLEQ